MHKLWRIVMNKVKSTPGVTFTDEELLSGRLFNQLAEEDKRLLSSVIKPSRYLSDDLLPAFYSYIIAYKVPNETELLLKLPEELLKYFDTDYSVLALDFKAELGDKTDLTILQVGCGRADLLVRLAQSGFSSLYGIECNPLQFQGAQKKIAGAGVTGKVTVAQAFVQDYDYSKIGKKIDVVIIHNFWGVIDPSATYKMFAGLNQWLTDDARIYIGPMYLMDTGKKKKSLLAGVWQKFYVQRRIKKVKKKFGIQIIFNIPLTILAKYGFKKDTLFFKYAGHHYFRQSRQC